MTAPDQPDHDPERRDLSPVTHRELYQLRQDYRNWANTTLVILTVLVLVNVAGAALTAYLLREDRHRASENAAAVAAIQGSRRASIYESCKGQNQQHRRIVREFPKVFPGAQTQPEVVATLIAPRVENCRVRADRLARSRSAGG